MKMMLAALLFLQAVQMSPLVENDFVRVFKNTAPCATAEASCGRRVVVALGSVELNGQKMGRGDIKVFKAGEQYSAPKSGDFLEIAIKPTHPKVAAPSPGAPPPPGNKVLYDGKDFTVFEEKMQPGEYSAPHSHNLRLAIFLNDTQVQQWTDGKEETRELVPDVVTWRPAVVHASKDVGSVPIRNILIEFKASFPMRTERNLVGY
jgi:quercetin dioxygenase-like cupin family protein